MRHDRKRHGAGGLHPIVRRQVACLLCRAQSEREAADALALIAARFDHGPLVVPVPVPHFYYAGMMIEVDVFAAADLQVRAPFEAGGVRLDLVDAGDQVWAHASVSSVDGALPVDPVSLIDDALARHGLHRDHLLGDLWMYAGDDDGARAMISWCAAASPDDKS